MLRSLFLFLPYTVLLCSIAVAQNVTLPETGATGTGHVPEAPALVMPPLEAPQLTAPSLEVPSRNTLEADVEPIAVQADEEEPLSARSQNEAENFPIQAQQAFETARGFLAEGGPSIWAIAALAVSTLALILWKIWRLALLGAWSRGKAGRAVAAFESGDAVRAKQIVAGRRGVRSKVVASAIAALDRLPREAAREDTARVAKNQLAAARSGLGALELISTIAPLLGLLGTVLGMIAAFQALQSAGSKADPSMLAGGIWEALLTTAAGMAVAIPASAALTWFEAVVDRIRRDIEDSATRLFVAEPPSQIRLAAE